MNKENFTHLWESLLPYIIYLAVTTVITAAASAVFPSAAGSVAVGTVGQIIMLPLLLWLLNRENMLRSTFEWKHAPLIDVILPAAAGAVIGAAVTWAVTSFISADADFIQAQEAYGKNIALTAVSSVILAPLMEELLFRALMYRRLEGLSGSVPAVIISSLFFAAGHASAVQVIYGFLMGVIFALQYRKRRTVFAPAVMHMTANLATIIMQYI